MQASKTTKLLGFKSFVLACLCVGLTLTLAMEAQAVVQLTDGTSVVNIDPDTQAGVRDWLVGGEDQLFQQWWWVEVNGSRFSIDAIGSPVVSNPSADKASAIYTDLVNGFVLEIAFELAGTASNQSLLKELVTIRNTSGNNLDISLVMYSDFDLAGTEGGDTASLLGLNDSVFPFGSTVGWERATQADGAYSHSAIWNGLPRLGELDFYNNTLTKLTSTLNPLSDDAGVVLPPTVGATSLSEYGPLGPGDTTYAIQWDFSLPAGASDGVGVDKRLVTPEPTTALLSLVGLAMLLRLRKRGS